MLEFDIAMARLTLATGQAETLLHGLGQRQYDLLALEQVVAELSGGRSVQRVVVDQSEDIRRAIAVHAVEQLQNIWSAIDHAGVAIADAASESELAPERARMLSGLVNNGSEGARRTAAELNQVVQVLTPIAQAAPGDQALARTARRGVDEASNRLESARREALRMAEALPLLIREMWEGLDSDRLVTEPQQVNEPNVTESPAAAKGGDHRRWLRPVSIGDVPRFLE